MAIVSCLPAIGGAPAVAEERGVKPLPIVEPSRNEVVLYEASFALIIAESDYRAGWRPLPGVKDDVVAVSAALAAHGFAVEVRENLDATGMDQTIRDFISRRGRSPANRLLIYYAGHGYTERTTYGENIGYLVPVDAPTPAAKPDEFAARALPIQRFEEYAKSVQSKHAMFVFDACFSGTLFELTRGDVPTYIDENTGKPVRQFITSGAADESVPDKSIFRDQFVRALSGEADTFSDGFVTGTELGEFLKNHVSSYSKGAQNPQHGKIRNPNLDKGDFVFVLPRAAGPRTPSAKPFEIGDLERKQESAEKGRQAWGADLTKMKQAFAAAERIDGGPLGPADKLEAWRRFLASFGDNNPYSTEDESLVQTARRRIEELSHPAASSAASGPRAGERIVVKVGDVDIPLRWIPAGKDTLGSRSGDPCHDDDEASWELTLSKGFWLMETEVTQALWMAVMGSNPSQFKECSRCPVESVSWDDAQAFVVRLNGIVAAGGFRLPTEAEWEYAVRAGSDTAFGLPCADFSEDTCSKRVACLDAFAWYWMNAGGKTHPVGLGSPNAWQLYDMHGNVWEWVQDGYAPYPAGAAKDHKGPSMGDLRVMRGGSWYDHARSARSANRSSAPPDFRLGNLGFRCARDGS